MALRARSSFLYGYQITATNRSLDFRVVSGGPILLAALQIGNYSLSDLLIEIKRAMTSAAPLFVFTITANRTISGGTQNRVTITSTSTYLDLLFASGPRVGSSVAPIIGFASMDRVGGVSYTGTLSTGTILVTEREGYNYTPETLFKEVNGATSISAIGDKETIVWGTMQFIEVMFMYEPESKSIMEWQPFMTWAIRQLPFDFTPEITSPNLFSNVTLESTSESSKGLGYQMKEQIPDFPFLYQTGKIKMRKKRA